MISRVRRASLCCGYSKTQKFTLLAFDICDSYLHDYGNQNWLQK